MLTKFAVSALAGAFLCLSGVVFAEAAPPLQQRIVQPIVVNGQRAQGVMIIKDGVVQSLTCPSPQPYVTTDQSLNGWACFDQATGTWLLGAIPPDHSENIYYEQTPVYVPGVPPYGYPYRYYGYEPGFYSYFGPAFGFGFNFGFHGHGHGGHGHGGFGHGGFGHGGFGHGHAGGMRGHGGGSFGHGGGGGHSGHR